jgi:NADPH:quinone reductase-like Zn-dependent oxidoreductase
MEYKRLIVSRYGGPEVLQVVEDKIPEPQPGQVRVKVLAAGVAWGDILRRRGISAPSPPFTPGYDLVGVVDRVGEGVTAVSEEQMVAALPITGGYAEFICLPATELVPVPADLDPAIALCLVLNYVTAYQILHRAAQVRPGERILVHGAAGGVGTALLQLAGLEGAEMYGTASSGKHELVASLGATPVDYRREDFVDRINALTDTGVDVVCDPIGGRSIWRSYKTLRRGGRLIAYGVHSIFTEGKVKTIGGLMLASILNLVPDKKSVRLYNITRPKYSSPEWCRGDLAKIFDLWRQGKIKPIVAERIPLAEAARAHELLENSAVMGKIVLICKANGEGKRNYG